MRGDRERMRETERKKERERVKVGGGGEKEIHTDINRYRQFPSYERSQLLNLFVSRICM